MTKLDIHNQFKESISRYKNHDPHLKRLIELPLVYHSPLLEEQAFNTPGIYLITGGRQIGKTTFLKQLILSLLSKKTAPKNIFFLTGEIIDTHHILRQIIDRFYDSSSSHQYLIIDEVNYIPDWDKSVKYLADSGILEKTTVILTGSDSQIIQTAMKRFAGRRGKADKTDFIFSPLSFKEFAVLKNKEIAPLCSKIINTPLTDKLPEYSQSHSLLIELFYEYLLHGGYLPAINEYAQKNTLSASTMNTYIHWIIGDILKYNKSEHHLYEILHGIETTYSTPVSWNSLSKHLSIEHHQTVSDYCKRMAPTYYIKGSKGEVDIALVQQKTMLPLEIKWTTRIRPEDLKQIQTYKNGIILTQAPQTRTINTNIVLPLIRFLVHIDDNRVVL